MRFRSDGAFAADDMASLQRGEPRLFCHTLAELHGIEPAQPGDTWRLRWGNTERRADGMRHAVPGDGPIAGYAICCPKCLHVHHWDTAANCPKTVPYAFTAPDGQQYSGAVCAHSSVGSCWNWSGSAESNLLTAQPSLYCVEALGGCGWHGFLTNGVLKHC